MNLNYKYQKTIMKTTIRLLTCAVVAAMSMEATRAAQDPAPDFGPEFTQSGNGGPCLPPLDGLVARWSGDGTTADWAGTSDGELRNGATFGDGLVGQAFSLDASTSAYAEFPAAATVACTTAISIEAWIRPTSGDGTVVSQYNSGRDATRWALDHKAGKLAFAVSRDGNPYGIWRAVLSEQVVIPVDTWTHVAATFDAGTQGLRLFVNGIEVPAELDSRSQVVDVIHPSDEPIRIGTEIWISGALSWFFTGLIDDVSIYKRALEPAEIDAIFAAGAAGKCNTPLIVTPPASQEAAWGTSLTLKVTAVGAEPLAYQWLKDGVAVAGASNASLILPNLQLTDAGAYTVIVSNAAGSVTSAPPALVTVKQADVAVALYAGVTIDGVVGQIYGIQSTTKLDDPSSWVGRTNVTLATPTYLWHDSHPATQPQQYYRVLPGPISVP